MPPAAVRLNVPAARLGEVLRVMADVALRPTFPAEELERLRQDV
jgi:predicted Zn-dependent peptidase